MSYTLGHFVATPAMRQKIDVVLDSGRLSYGPLCAEFEQRFAMAHQRLFGVLSNSGTSSLQVALQAMKELYGWEDDCEVIVPALTFVATINIVYHCRLKPILVDVEPDYYAIQAERIEAAITPRTRCIIPVHPFGQAADMSAIQQIAQKHDLRVIEDSCEAMFVTHDKISVGAWSDVGCFSTYVAHLMVGGIGGIGICNDINLAQKMRSLVNHGIELNSLPTGERVDPSFLGRNFQFSSIGHSFRVTEMEAALLLPQLDTIEQDIATRRVHAAKLLSLLGEFSEELILPKIHPKNTHAWMVFPITLREEKKHGLMAYLRQHHVEVRDLLPLTNQRCYNFKSFLYPVSHRLNQHAFYIGCHPYLQDEDFQMLYDNLHAWFHTPIVDLRKDVEFMR